MPWKSERMRKIYYKQSLEWNLARQSFIVQPLQATVPVAKLLFHAQLSGHGRFQRDEASRTVKSHREDQARISRIPPMGTPHTTPTVEARYRAASVRRLGRAYCPLL